jgi:hypothetical protein
MTEHWRVPVDEAEPHYTSKVSNAAPNSSPCKNQTVADAMHTPDRSVLRNYWELGTAPLHRVAWSGQSQGAGDVENKIGDRRSTHRRSLVRSSCCSRWLLKAQIAFCKHILSHEPIIYCAIWRSVTRRTRQPTPGRLAATDTYSTSTMRGLEGSNSLNSLNSLSGIPDMAWDLP